MNLYLLLIPIGIIVATGLSIYGLFERGNVFRWSIGLKDIDRYVISLMTVADDNAWLRVSVKRRITYLYAEFTKDRAQLLLPLLTRSQIKHKAKLLEILKTADPDARLVSIPSGPDSIEAQVFGKPDNVAEQLKRLVLRLFDVDEKRRLELLADARRSDLLRLGHKFVELRDQEINGRTWQRTTAGRDTFRIVKQPTGFLRFISGYLLVPLPFVVACIWYGVTAACAVHLIVLGIATMVWIISGYNFVEPVPGRLLSLAVAAGCLATLVFDEARFVQSVPSVVCLLLFIYTAMTLLPGRSWFDISGPRAAWMSRSDRWFITSGIAVAALFAMAVNELLSIFAGLDVWIWYFAFLRLDVVLFLLITSAPMPVLDPPQTQGAKM